MNLITDEVERLRVLNEYKILDTNAEESFDDLARLAARICEVPIALVSLVDADRQWFKARVGLDVCQTSRSISFCAFAIREPGLFVVEDAALDSRFAGNPLVTGEPFIRFYAGAPLVTAAGYALGTICVIDSVPRRLSAEQQEALQVCARQIIKLLEARRAAFELETSNQRLLSEIAEHHSTEQDLRESKEQFDLVMRGTDDGIWDWNTKTGKVYFSPRWKTMLGYELDEVPNNIEAFISHVHPDDWERVEKSLDRYFQGKADFYSEEIRMRCKDGSDKCVLARGVVTRDEAGAPVRMTGTHVDLSERKAMENQLRESEERYRQMFENTQTVNLVIDPESQQIVDANRAACDFYGYSLARLREMKISDISTSTADSIEASINKTIREPRSSFFIQHRLASSELREVQANAVPLVIGNRQLLHCAIYDITEERRAVAKLQASEVRFRRLLENAIEQITIFDCAGIAVYVSPAVIHLMGYAPAEVIGHHILEAVHPEDLTVLRQMFEQLLAQPGWVSPSLQYRQRKRDGSWQILESICMNLLDDPAVNGIVVNTRDVTERRRTEDELRRSAEQLQQSQKMEAVGQLAGGIAHDFNNIMTAVIGCSDLALRKLPEDAPVRRYLTEIKRAGERAAGLTQHLLAFSRKQVLQPQPLDLPTLINNLEILLTRLIGEDVKLIIKGETAVIVNADQSQLEQVLINLIVNARDAIRESGKTNGQIIIETASVVLDKEYAARHVAVQPGEYVLLAISDNGAGMSGVVRRRALEPFFTTKELGKGTGLGLSTVYGIVKQSGGNIWLYSEPNVGTTVKIYLPSVAEAVIDSPITAETAAMPGGSETILLVEDEESVRAMTSELLRSFGYHVITALNGSEAIKIYQQSRHQEIDLLVTDLVMPQMGGKQLVAEIHQRDSRLPVLLMSGYTSEAVVQQGHLPAGVSFIAKPFAADALARKLRELLDSQTEPSLKA